MTTESVEYKSFGVTSDVSSCCPPSLTKQTNEDPVSAVDQTYKLYYGGSHKRPDGNLSYVVLDGTGKIHASVADGSR